MNELIEYVRDESGRPIGCVLALGKDQVGYSLCYTVDEPFFTKEKARRIARGRAKTGEDWYERLADVVNARLDRGKSANCAKMIIPIVQMQERAKKYFKE